MPCNGGVAYNTLVSNQISICAHQKPKEESVYEIFAATQRRAAKWPRGRGTGEDDCLKGGMTAWRFARLLLCCYCLSVRVRVRVCVPPSQLDVLPAVAAIFDVM